MARITNGCQQLNVRNTSQCAKYDMLQQKATVTKESPIQVKRKAYNNLLP
jgi:hypothetical protein